MKSIGPYFCSFGRHSWIFESGRRKCRSCGQAEISRRDAYGEGGWEATSKGNYYRVSLRDVAAVSGWIVAVVLLVLLIVGWDGDGNLASTPPSEFVGIPWEAKSGASPVGPGPNFFSDKNVRVDDDGNLHLEIRKIAGRWSSAEVDSGISFGYGTYAFTLGNVPDEFDKNVVLAFFIWDDAPDQNHREIDIEFRLRDIDGETYPGAYIVQPWDRVGNTQEFQTIPSPGFEYSFRWSFGKVEFFIRDSEGNLVESWTHEGESVPEPGNESARINLWLAGGTPPSNLQPVKIVVNDFSFNPL